MFRTPATTPTELYAGSTPLPRAGERDQHRSGNVTPRHQERHSHAPEILQQLHRRLQEIVIADEPTLRVIPGAERVDVNSAAYARKVARKLFTGLSHLERNHLIVTDFVPYFPDRSEAERAFAIFDKDGNGDISKREMKDAVLSIYRERKALANSLRDLSQAVGKLDKIFSFASLIVFVFATLLVFNVDVVKSLVSLGSILLTLTFVFGNTAKNTFESILFLFVIVSIVHVKGVLLFFKETF